MQEQETKAGMQKRENATDTQTTPRQHRTTQTTATARTEPQPKSTHKQRELMQELSEHARATAKGREATARNSNRMRKTTVKGQTPQPFQDCDTSSTTTAKTQKQNTAKEDNRKHPQTPESECKSKRQRQGSNSERGGCRA